MAIKYEVVATNGEYEKDGQTKKRYVNMGRVIEMKNGSLALKIDSLPVNWDGWAYLNTPREKDASGGNYGSQSTDDVPF